MRGQAKKTNEHPDLERTSEMTGRPNCDRCRRIQAAIDEGLSPHEAREANGWDECAEDGCPILPKPYVFKTCAPARTGVS
jgi:hypothetical protein